MSRLWLAVLGLAAGVARADGPPPAPPVWVTQAGGTAPAWTPAAPQPPKADDPPRPPSKPLPLPKIPLPETAPPPKPVEPPPEQPKALPPPRPVDPPATPKPDPAVPPALPPVPPAELPAAQPEPCLEPHPGGVGVGGVFLPARRGVVGSPNLSLSRDGSVLDLFGAGLFADEADTAVLGEAAAGDRSFVSLEYLLWWVRPAAVPALATTGGGQNIGYLGEPGTQTLLGPGSFGSTSRNGFRARAGTWFDNGSGLDGSYFFLGRQTTTAAIDSAQYPTIARPFFAPNLGREFAEVVASPGLSTGRLVAETSSRLWGADVNARTCLLRTCDSRAEVFAGYRHLNLREDLGVTEFITASGPLAPDPVGTSVVVNDTFRTRNQFHGGQVGWAASKRAGRFDVSARASVALGATHQQLEISGSQLRTRPGAATEAFTGGLLAAGPNLGSFSRTRFSVAPEATLNVGLWLTPGVKAFVGYNFLYWTNTLRPGDQIDRVVDLSFVPNGGPYGVVANRPLPTFRQADVWAQGVQFGVEARW